MPFEIIENKAKGTYKVTNKETGELYAKATKNPQKLIAAIEINKKKDMPMPKEYALHAVVIHKDGNTLEQAKKWASDIIKDSSRTFYRTDSMSWRFRNLPKTVFDSKTFRSKVVNPNITLIFGELK
jgi:DNA replicative helicase MCM subunit Mcm2 (Cdc46/Mcm family)